MLIQLKGLLEFALHDRSVVDRCHDPIEDLGGCRKAHKEQGEEDAGGNRPSAALLSPRVRA
jgi:hypothetical protein